MSNVNHHISIAQKRSIRVRKRLHGTAERPRVSVLRSNKHTSVQAINDDLRVTVAAAHDIKAKPGQTKMEKATEVAKALASSLQKQGIKAAVLDRGSYRYHGRIRIIAETLRTAGIQV
jgi:large subunit ribosomal protein L18